MVWRRKRHHHTGTNKADSRSGRDCWALHYVPVGEEWPIERMLEMKKLADKHNLHIEVVESVNVHEDIKSDLQLEIDT
ncbi:Mannonate dehydratase [Bacillus safensis subsp. safensis]